jgi:hypothetical protein
VGAGYSVRILILDQPGSLPLSRYEANLFFQLLVRRSERGSLTVTSNKGFTDWDEVFNDHVLTTAKLRGLDKVNSLFVCACAALNPRRLPRPIRWRPHRREAPVKRAAVGRRGRHASLNPAGYVTSRTVGTMASAVMTGCSASSSHPGRLLKRGHRQHLPLPHEPLVGHLAKCHRLSGGLADGLSLATRVNASGDLRARLEAPWPASVSDTYG